MSKKIGFQEIPEQARNALAGIGDILSASIFADKKGADARRTEYRNLVTRYIASDAAAACDALNTSVNVDLETLKRLSEKAGLTPSAFIDRINVEALQLMLYCLIRESIGRSSIGFPAPNDQLDQSLERALLEAVTNAARNMPGFSAGGVNAPYSLPDALGAISAALDDPPRHAKPSNKSKSGYVFGSPDFKASDGSAFEMSREYNAWAEGLYRALKAGLDEIVHDNPLPEILGVSINVTKEQMKKMATKNFSIVDVAAIVNLATNNLMKEEGIDLDDSHQRSSIAEATARLYLEEIADTPETKEPGEFVTLALSMPNDEDCVAGFSNANEVKAEAAKIIEALVAKDEAQSDAEADEDTDAADQETIEIPEIDNPFESVTIDPALAPAVDSLLATATKGKVANLGSVVSSFGAALKAVESARNAIDRMRLQSSISALAPQPGAPLEPGALSYETKMIQAGDIFKTPSGRRASNLKLKLAKLVWKDGSGNTVRHPLVPEIDKGYVFQADILLKMLVAIATGQYIWLHGLHGTGKSSLFEQICARLGWPITILNMDSDLTRDNLVGSVELTETNGTTTTRFRRGILPTAMVQPGFVVFDECDAALPGLLFVIQKAAAKTGLVLSEEGGEVIKPHPLFRMGATANTRGLGDEMGIFPGVRPMNQAFLDRWDIMIEVDYLNATDEERMLTNRFGKDNKSMIEKVVAFANDIRRAFRNGEISHTLTPRGEMAFLTQFLSLKAFVSERQALDLALAGAVIDRFAEDSQQAVKSIASRTFG